VAFPRQACLRKPAHIFPVPVLLEIVRPNEILAIARDLLKAGAPMMVIPEHGQSRNVLDQEADGKAAAKPGKEQPPNPYPHLKHSFDNYATSTP
jgi:hypothetical protein